MSHQSRATGKDILPSVPRLAVTFCPNITILAELAGFAPPPLRSGSAQRQSARLASLAHQIP